MDFHDWLDYRDMHLVIQYSPVEKNWVATASNSGQDYVGYGETLFLALQSFYCVCRTQSPDNPPTSFDICKFIKD